MAYRTEVHDKINAILHFAQELEPPSDIHEDNLFRRYASIATFSRFPVPSAHATSMSRLFVLLLGPWLSGVVRVGGLPNQISFIQRFLLKIAFIVLCVWVTPPSTYDAVVSADLLFTYYLLATGDGHASDENTVFRNQFHASIFREPKKLLVTKLLVSSNLVTSL